MWASQSCRTKLFVLPHMISPTSRFDAPYHMVWFTFMATVWECIRHLKITELWVRRHLWIWKRSTYHHTKTEKEGKEASTDSSSGNGVSSHEEREEREREEEGHLSCLLKCTIVPVTPQKGLFFESDVSEFSLFFGVKPLFLLNNHRSRVIRISISFLLFALMRAE